MKTAQIVARTVVGPLITSTIQSATDTSFHTRIFGGYAQQPWAEDYHKQHATHTRAEAGHADAVAHATALLRAEGVL